MITCPSCNHQNPEGSLQCENCYNPLPATASCPKCGASVQTDATFCGQCGFNLQAENSSTPLVEETATPSLANTSNEDVALGEGTAFPQTTADILPETAISPAITSPWDIDEREDAEQSNYGIEPFPEQLPPDAETTDPIYTTSEEFINLEEVDPPRSEAVSQTNLEFEPFSSAVEQSESASVEPDEPKVESTKAHSSGSTPSVSANVTMPKTNMVGATQLQIQTCSLLHVQSNTSVEIPSNLDVVHIGKPNGQIPPDIDVAGFPDSEVVSRVHADLRIEGDAYYIEDVGSSNGTYVNHAPLFPGNRHRLRAGDRIGLGKGDLVTFIFKTD